MIAAVILGGGTGSRMALGSNKVLHEVAGMSMLTRSAAAFRPFADRLVIVLRAEERETALAQLAKAGLDAGEILWADPGETRQASVRHALDCLADLPEETAALIHDGARCLVDALLAHHPHANILLMGDFNMTLDDPSMAPAKKNLQNCRQIAAKSDDLDTCHDWGRNFSAIDFIWEKGFGSCVEYETLTKEYGGRAYISDHYPILAKLIF